ncbi:hypothetical protein ACPPVQ_11785 [Diaminobutyricibacter sp. McL0618]|uniref:hypothetical protein n=1 Tax=Leifsonia sp. McL0618 TaxID=3415677 RepID=UPI003CF2A989
MTDTTLEQGATAAIRVVKRATAKIPADWILEKGPEQNHYNYCDGTIDTGPRGSAQWLYGFAFDLTHEVPNGQLLSVMEPTGKEWSLLLKEPNVQGGTAMDYRFTDGRTQLYITLNGESSTRPRVGVSAYGQCIRNGETGPGTFPTPNPADITG